MFDENYKKDNHQDAAESHPQEISIGLLARAFSRRDAPVQERRTRRGRKGSWGCRAEQILDVPERSVVWQARNVEEVAQQWVQICGVHSFLREIPSEGRAVG